MTGKESLRECVDEIDLVNRAYAFLNAGSKADKTANMSKILKLVERKNALKKTLPILITNYFSEL